MTYPEPKIRYNHWNLFHPKAYISWGAIQLVIISNPRPALYLLLPKPSPYKKMMLSTFREWSNPKEGINSAANLTAQRLIDQDPELLNDIKIRLHHTYEPLNPVSVYAGFRK